MRFSKTTKIEKSIASQSEFQFSFDEIPVKIAVNVGKVLKRPVHEKAEETVSPLNLEKIVKQQEIQIQTIKKNLLQLPKSYNPATRSFEPNADLVEFGSG